MADFSHSSQQIDMCAHDSVISKMHVRALINKFYKVNISRLLVPFRPEEWNKSDVAQNNNTKYFFYGRRASFINFYFVLDESLFFVRGFYPSRRFIQAIHSMFGAFVLFHILIYCGERKRNFYPKKLQINSHNKNIIFLHGCRVHVPIAYSAKYATWGVEYRKYTKWLNCSTHITLTACSRKIY